MLEGCSGWTETTVFPLWQIWTKHCPAIILCMLGNRKDRRHCFFYLTRKQKKWYRLMWEAITVFAADQIVHCLICIDWDGIAWNMGYLTLALLPFKAFGEGKGFCTIFWIILSYVSDGFMQGQFLSLILSCLLHVILGCCQSFYALNISHPNILYLNSCFSYNECSSLFPYLKLLILLLTRVSCLVDFCLPFYAL